MAAPDKDAIGAILTQALESENQGRMDEAALLFELVLASAPDHFELLFHLAALRFRQGQFERALPLFSRAANLQPREPLAWSNLALVYLMLKQPEEALTCCDRALALQAEQPEALNSRGNALWRLARVAEAAESFERALAHRPHYVEALVNYGCVLKELGRHENALAALDKALDQRSDIAVIFSNRAAVLIELRRPAEAIVSADRALALAPDNVQALNNRGSALKLLKRPQEALAACNAALAIDPTCAEVWSNLAGVLADLKHPEEALECFDRALALNPWDAAGHQNKSIILGELGRFEEAGRAIRQAIALDPDCARFHYNLTQLERLSRAGPEAVAMEALARAQELFDVKDRIYLHYALAKVHEDNGEMEAAFERQCAGAALKRCLIDYDEAAMLGAMERTELIFDAALIRKLAGSGDSSLAPIFIVGMPRSGSTLVEQILASHAGVAGLGEIDAFGKAMSDFDGPMGGVLQFPDAAASMSAVQLQRIGASYVRRVGPLVSAAERIVDKMLDNFRYLGLIHLALPNARFIHIRRDPIETCLSCFSKWFADALDYSYDLAELGRYYRACERLMAHWRGVLPQGVMLEAQYEEIVRDLEGQSRRLAAFCGLEWDARCLEFHKTERQVRTASKMQVRQPLFNRTAERKTALDGRLAPLRAGLGLPVGTLEAGFRSSSRASN